MTTECNVLLPFCVECETDVFLKILKDVVGRRGTEDPHYLIKALKEGLKLQTLSVNLDDLSANWKELVSVTEQTKQWKWIGFWGIANFPFLGKKLCGDSWTAPDRQSIDIVGGRGTISVDEMDSFIFKKMKIRVIELTVSPSTLDKVKSFVKIPPTAGVRITYEKTLTAKMKVFGIEAAFVSSCWEALKCGKFSIRVSFLYANVKDKKNLNVNASNIRIRPQPQIDYSELNGNSTPSNKRQGDANIGDCSESDEDSTPSAKRQGDTNIGDVGFQLLPPAKRRCVDASQVYSNSDGGEIGISPVADNDSFRLVLNEMSKNIENLIKWMDPTTEDGPERLHVMIIRQKDDQITGLKDTVKELEKINKNLSDCQSKVTEQFEQQKSLIITLQKGVEATTTLRLKSEMDLAATKQSNAELTHRIESMTREMTELESTRVTEIAAKDAAIKETGETRERNAQLITQNDVLARELADWKNNAVREAAARESAASEIAATKQSNAELIDRIESMTREMTELESTRVTEIAAKDAAIKETGETRERNAQLITQNDVLARELADWKNNADREAAARESAASEIAATKQSNAELTDRIESMTREMTELESTRVTEIAAKDAAIKETGETRERNAQLITQNDVLARELADWKNNAAREAAARESAASEIAATKQSNAELTDRIESMTREMTELESTRVTEIAAKDAAIKETGETRERNAQLITQNDVLARELADWKNNAAREAAARESAASEIAATKQSNAELTDRIESMTREMTELESTRVTEIAAKDAAIKETGETSERNAQLNHEATATLQSNTIQMGQAVVSTENVESSCATDSIVPIVTNDKNTIPPNSGTSSAESDNSRNELPEPVFKTTDPIVLECRDDLLKLRFGWVTFYSNKGAKFVPGFVHPADSKGVECAQKVTSNGFVTKKKYTIFGYENNLPDCHKDKSCVRALNKLNENFNFSFS